MNLREHIESRSVRSLVRLSCVLALAGLAILCLSVLVPRPIPIIFAMSGGHAIGVAAVACYVLAVLLDLGRREGVLPPSLSSRPDAAPHPSAPEK